MSILSLTRVLHLGLVDEGSFDKFNKGKEKYFKHYHARFWDVYSENKNNSEEKNREIRKHLTPLLTRFRGEALGEWVEPKSVSGDDITQLQTFLRDHGFMPGARVDGVFGYWTLASVRLFQEYVRTIEGFDDINLADGRVFKGTHKHMLRWKEKELQADWGKFSWKNPTEEFKLWMNLLNQVKENYEKALLNAPDPAQDKGVLQLQMTNKWRGKTDTRKIAKWTFDPKEVHLLGIRCQHDVSNKKRGNDDLFILLINGLVFKFWGSTDPKPSRSDGGKIEGHEPYLVEGQHKYRFSWHKRGDSKKVYKALVPYQNGVLVFRDWDDDDALTEKSIRKHGLGNPTGKKKLNNPNWSINIHWTQDTNNWSAGCQVIAGSSYLNHKGKLVNCSAFAAQNYDSLSAVSKPGVKKNQGAYTFISDLAMVYTPDGIDHVVYTLGQDSIFEKEGLDTKELMKNIAAPELGIKSIHDLVNLMKS